MIHNDKHAPQGKYITIKIIRNAMFTSWYTICLVIFIFRIAMKFVIKCCRIWKSDIMFLKVIWNTTILRHWMEDVAIKLQTIFVSYLLQYENKFIWVHCHSYNAENTINFYDVSNTTVHSNSHFKSSHTATSYMLCTI